MKLLLFVGFLLLMALAMSCNPVKKATRIFDQNPLDASEYCVLRFPGDSTITFIKGDTIRDTITEMVDVLTYVTCPPATKDTVIQVSKKIEFKKVIEKIHDTVKITIENPEKVKAAFRIRDKALVERDVAKETAKSLGKWNIWLVVLCVVEGLIIFRKPLIAAARGLLGIPTFKA